MNIPIESWFENRGWKPFDFQRETWDAYLRGDSGVVHAPTGVGKTYAVSLGPLIEWMKGWDGAEAGLTEPAPLQMLWITPLRALANDTVKNLKAPLTDLRLPWSVEMRTGDTPTTIRERQRTRAPSILVLTPENLSLMLSYPETEKNFRTLRCVVVDEWHELLGSKRGVQTELALARLRNWLPHLRTWGLSATLGNTEQAMEVLLGMRAEGLGQRPESPHPARSPGVLIQGDHPKQTVIETLLPDDMEHFPWAGHMGLVMLPQVLETLEKANSTLLFTNTRSQAEMWFRTLLNERPEWGTRIALHHGSMEKDIRRNVEIQLRAGEMKCVVCTSSLDLGVDFSPVDQVIQLGGPKGVARLLQRAGRSGHQPGAISRIVCVPTQALEIVEFGAVQDAIFKRQLEARRPLERCLDVLVQHLVTVGLGSGFRQEAMLSEVRTAHGYRQLTDPEWRWCLHFVTGGGPALGAYPQYSKVVERNKLFNVPSPQIGRLHRMSIGTITSDSMLKVQFMKGGVLGTIEESFVSRLLPGEAFSFAGHILQLLQIRDMTAYVKRSSNRKGAIPRWMGGRLPLSTELAAAVRQKLNEAKHDQFVGREMEKVKPVLELQARWSKIPAPDELLIEQTSSQEGHHVFLFPFAGRLVQQGLSSLLAYRLARDLPQTIRVAANDYGMELLSLKPWNLSEVDWRRYLSAERLMEDLMECLNATEMARRRFRDIARIAGLLFQGYPGAGKSTKQLQASSSLFYDVFVRYDPGNLLIDQARREVLESQLEFVRLKEALEEIQTMKIVMAYPRRLSPLAFPIWSERMQQSQVTTEPWGERIRRMSLQREEIESAMKITIQDDRQFAERWKKRVAALPEIK